MHGPQRTQIQWFLYKNRSAWIESLIILNFSFLSSLKGKNGFAGPVELGWQGWQLPPQYFDFFKVSTKKIENQTKIGQLAAISNFCLILFISSQNSFCKTVHFLAPIQNLTSWGHCNFFRGLSKKDYQTRPF